MPCKFLVSLFVLTGALAADISAQQKPGERLVSCQRENIRLADFFSQVWNQVRLQAFYNDEQISSDERVTVNFNNEPLDNVLAFLLRKRGLTWYYREETFVILPKRPGDPDLGKLPEEVTVNVKGIVTDTHGEPLQNATVMVKGARKGVSTDKGGKFILSDINKRSALTITCVGFTPMDIQLSGNDHPVSVQLEELITGLDEVVVIAYGASSRRYLTGSVSKVTGEEIMKQPVSDPLVALQGRTPGLFITQTSGLPGGEVKVELRGRNSIDAGNNPMYIVDGVPFPGTALTLNNVLKNGVTISPLGASNPLNMINIADIASIEVLKDAAATAIYGSRGANGVILVTTKTGQPAKLNMDVNLYTGVGTVAHHVKYLDTRQYLQMRREAFGNDNSTPHDVDSDLLSWDSTRNINWERELLGRTAHITDGQVAFSGGSPTMQVRISGGYRRETTAYPGSFEYSKAAGRINLALSTPDKRGRIAVAASYVGDQNYLPKSDLAVFVITPPNAPAVYNADGLLNWESGFNNVMANLLKYYKANTSNLMTNATLSYELVRGLQVKASVGYNQMLMDEMQPNSFRSVNPANGAYPGVTRFANGSSRSWIAEPQLSYLGKLSKGQLSVLAGCTFQQEIRNQEGVSAVGYTNEALIENKAAAGKLSPFGGSAYYQYRYSALFTRIDYNWEGKYIASLTGRRDGSSRFGPGRQFANFGAAGLAWIFSKERWSGNILPFLSFGKLRASYGTAGNDQIADYGYITTYAAPADASYQGLSGLWPTRLFNPGYGWELNKKLELGLELGVAQDRLLLRANWYRNRSSNQLVNYSLSGLSGFKAIQSNFPAVVQNTGVELELNAVNIKQQHFSWTSMFNISIPDNKLLAFPGLETSSYNLYYTIGRPLNVLKGFHYLGVNPETGVYEFEDVNKDGKLTAPADYNTTKKLGVILYGGMQHSLRYKGWQLDLLCHFVKQRRYDYLSVYANYAPGARMMNQPLEVLQRWRAPGDRTNIQRFTQDVSDVYNANSIKSKSDAAVADASFIRLKNVMLSYELPASWTQRLHLQSARFYMQGQNLLTITGYKGRDPEVATSLDVYPPLRVWTLGLQLNL
ncbi:MAG TPA: SusC/RagA family TonB-linked outer membrane protein [Chitinophaga sp.]